MEQIRELTPEFLAGLKNGDTFETAGVFLGLSDAPLVWRFDGRDKLDYLFTLRYAGIWLGQFLLTPGSAEIEEVS